ncbi:hypothetical protein N7490_012280 [Penicillium lividum]|nr:hypothetical protein N7490_012280 [Penicillium lividum]
MPGTPRRTRVNALLGDASERPDDIGGLGKQSLPYGLDCAAGKDILLENSALLHAIYALSVFNKFQRVGSSSLPYSISAIKHYQLSLEYLWQASMQQREAELEVVLATISGRAWLQSIERSKWTRLQKSATYQFFLCAEAIGSGSVLPRAAKDTPLGNIRARAFGDSDYVHDSTFGVTSISLDADYVLDKYFGITKPIWEAITHINHILASPYRPSKTELEGPEIRIRLNRPISVLNRRVNFDPENQALIDYHMMFYYACYIHFKRNLLHTASEDLQGIVRHTILHLRNIEIHKMTYGCCGILWSNFLIACESDEQKSRNAFLSWFFTKARLSIGSLSSALALIVEVRRRRDAARCRDNGSCFVSWAKVMAEMGLDLFIV